MNLWIGEERLTQLDLLFNVYLDLITFTNACTFLCKIVTKCINKKNKGKPADIPSPQNCCDNQIKCYPV